MKQPSSGCCHRKASRSYAEGRPRRWPHGSWARTWRWSGFLPANGMANLLGRRGSPPTAKLSGVDLVTEGILTLGQAVTLLETAETVHDLPADDDAATRLARILLQADDIHLIVGKAINPNQVADLIRGEPMRLVYVYVRQLVEELQRRTKQVSLERI